MSGPEDQEFPEDTDGHGECRQEIDQLRTENARKDEALRKVMRFWGGHEAWGDFASLTSAAGAFGPVAEACRTALLPDSTWLKNYGKKERVEEVQEAAEHACDKCHLGLMVRLAALGADPEKKT